MTSTARRRSGTCRICGRTDAALVVAQIIESASGAGGTVWACTPCTIHHPGLCPEAPPTNNACEVHRV